LVSTRKIVEDVRLKKIVIRETQTIVYDDGRARDSSSVSFSVMSLYLIKHSNASSNPMLTSVAPSAPYEGAPAAYGFGPPIATVVSAYPVQSMPYHVNHDTNKNDDSFTDQDL
jgi:hypothetical protein